jgi:hypothetical protein
VEFVGAPNKEDLQAEANAANLAHKAAQEQRISA